MAELMESFKATLAEQLVNVAWVIVGASLASEWPTVHVEGTVSTERCQ